MMSVSVEIIGLAVMVVVALFLFGVIRGLQRNSTERKRRQQAEQTAKLLNAVAYEEWEKKRLAEIGRAPKTTTASDFKQTRN